MKETSLRKGRRCKGAGRECLKVFTQMCKRGVVLIWGERGKAMFLKCIRISAMNVEDGNEASEAEAGLHARKRQSPRDLAIQKQQQRTLASGECNPGGELLERILGTQTR